MCETHTHTHTQVIITDRIWEKDVKKKKVTLKCESLTFIIDTHTHTHECNYYETNNQADSKVCEKVKFCDKKNACITNKIKEEKCNKNQVIKKRHIVVVVILRSNNNNKNVSSLFFWLEKNLHKTNKTPL